MNPYYTTQAICLKTYDYSETSRIVHFYSPKAGLIRAVAKGVRRPKSKLSGACERMNASTIHLSRGKNLDVLCQYESLRTFLLIRSHLLPLAFAMVFTELVNLVATEHDLDSTFIYEALFRALSQLNSLYDKPSETDRHPIKEVMAITIAFHQDLLDAAGYWPVMDQCLLTHQSVTYDRPYYAFLPELGGIALNPDASELRTFSRVHISTPTLRALKKPSKADFVLEESADPVKILKFLAYYTGYKLEKTAHAYAFAMDTLVSTLPPLSSSTIR